MADVELVQLGPAAVGGGDELAARAPAEAPHRVLGYAQRPRGRAAGRCERPSLVCAGALIRHHRERAGVWRQCESRTTGESPRRVRHLGEPLARMEVRQRSVRHGAMLVRQAQGVLLFTPLTLSGSSFTMSRSIFGLR